jgi:peptidoglycan hydrolase-like protein with peptidoglycan-binding domain
MHTIKKAVLGLFLAAVLIAPTQAQAQTPSTSYDSLLAQISSLLEIVSSLQAQLAHLRDDDTPSTATTPTPQYSTPSICSVLKRSLYLGARGDDVRELQEFLHSEGDYDYPEITGYFGPATERAVQKWQARRSVVSTGNPDTTGFGVVGPQTRNAFGCGGGGGGNVNTERFNASPTSGSAPLTVTFSTWLSGFRPNSITYTIDFGDGTSERAADCNAPADACVSAGQNTHTYTNNGTYTATLNKITDPCGGNPLCLAPIETKVVGKVQIRVGDQIACTTASCGPALGMPAYTCPDGSLGGNTGRCIRQSNGSCGWEIRSCLADQSSNKPPVISSFSGPTTLAVNQTGTWTINASDPENGTLTYSIDWGDSAGATAFERISALASSAFKQQTTFQHSYSRAGTYTITMTVRDNAGNETRTTSTVRVGTDEPIVCTQEAKQCPDGSWVGRTGSNCEFASCPGSGSTPEGTSGSPSTADNSSGDTTRTSCITPWKGLEVKSGNRVSSQPEFTNGIFSWSTVVSQMMCNNGKWLTCGWEGNNCK